MEYVKHNTYINKKTLAWGEGEEAVDRMIAKGSASTYWENGVEMMQMQKHLAGKTETHRETGLVNQAVPIIAIYTEYVKFISLQIQRFHVYKNMCGA